MSADLLKFKNGGRMCVCVCLRLPTEAKPMSKEKLKTQIDKGLTGTVRGSSVLWRREMGTRSQ